MEYGPTSRNNVRSFLEGPHRAVLSTVGREGSPHLVVVDDLVGHDRLLVKRARDRRWVLNLRQDPRVSALVDDRDDVSHWVRLTGTAELSARG